MVVTQARTADSLVDSIGVNSHFSFVGTPYLNYPLMAQRIGELGVRHLRDGWSPASTFASNFVQASLKPLGVKMTMYFDPRHLVTQEQSKNMVRDQLTGSVDTVESLNEWDLNGTNATWSDVARSWTIGISTAMRNDPATRSIPIIGPSIAGSDDPARFQRVGDLSGYIDYGSSHDYPGYRYQMTDDYIDMVKYSNTFMVGSKPIIATETGYSNGFLDNPYYTGTPEAQVAQLLPRVFVDHYRKGFVRSFSYELIDERPDNNFESKFGLLRYDGTPKPAFYAMSNLIHLLQDPGTGFNPGSLSYSLTGTDANTRTVLLQKRDGRFYLIINQQTSVFDGAHVLNPPDVPVTLQLPSAATMTTYRPSTTANPISTTTGATLNLQSNEELTIVEIGGATQTPATTTTTQPAGPAPASAGSGTTTRFVSDLGYTQISNGHGPAEKDRSNGEQGANDGHRITIGGVGYDKGIGAHSDGAIDIPLNGQCSSFQAKVGIDAEVGGKGSVVFQIFNNGNKIYDSGLVTGATTKDINIATTGMNTLRLVANTGGDNNFYDHADWADAKITCGATQTPATTTTQPAPTTTTTQPAGPAPASAGSGTTTRFVSDLGYTQISNGHGPAEKDRSNGEQGANDGHRITIGGVGYDKGIGAHSDGAIDIPLNGQCSSFQAKVGIDAEVGGKGSVVFQIFNNGNKIYDSGLVTGATTKDINIATTGMNTLRLVANTGGDNNFYDHADWADAKITCV
jgi:hypothetical protein